MKIVDGFIAVAIPYMVSICPHADGWGVILYGGPEADTVSGIVMKHWLKTAPEAKLWASEEIGRRFQRDFDLDAPTLIWEHLVCNPTEE